MESWSFWTLMYLSALAVVGWAFTGCHRRAGWKVFFLPAIALEGTVIALTASLAGQKVRRFGGLGDGQPFVELTETRRPWLGPLIRLTVRQVVFVTAFFLLCSWIDAVWQAKLPLPEQNLAVADAPEKIGGIVALLQALGRVISEIPLTSPYTWLFVYLVLGLSMAFALDVREWVAGVVVIVAATLVVSTLRWLGFGYGFLSRAWWIRWLYGSDAAGAFALLCGFAMILALVGFISRTAVQSVRGK